MTTILSVAALLTCLWVWRGIRKTGRELDRLEELVVQAERAELVRKRNRENYWDEFLGPDNR